jgi:hypothetical protein
MIQRKTARPGTRSPSKPSASDSKQPSKGGRPAHQPTPKDRQTVEVLAGFAIPAKKICQVIGISEPVLFKYYADEMTRGGAKVEAQLVGNLLRLAAGSDGTALKAIMFALNCRFGWSAYAPAPVRDEPLGKKEEAQRLAETAHESSDWGKLLQ